MTTQELRWILGGGLASGKSLVRRLLADAGVSTIDSDTFGHEVLEPGGAAFEAVSRRWPHVVSAGRIDRRELASVVFNDRGELAELEAMTHPHIFDTIGGRVEEIRGPVVVEMPVVTGRLGSEWRVMVIDSRHEEKLQRAIARGMDETDARARLSVQLSREEWLAMADLVIPNHGSIADLEDTVVAVVGLL